MGMMHGALIVFFFLLGALNTWLLSRLAGEALPRPILWCCGAATLLAALSLQPVWLTQSSAQASLFNALFGLAAVWLGAQLFLLPLLLVLGLLSAATKACGAETLRSNLRISRRAFLQGAACTAPLLAFGLSGKGAYEALREMEVSRLTLAFSELPPALDGFVIAQISDAHLGPYFSLPRLEEALALVDAAQADLLVITGDLIGDRALLEAGVKRIGELAAKLRQKVYFCWGNHEYYHPIEAVRAAIEDAGIVILDNESRRIKVGEDEFYLAGVDYPRGTKKEAEEKRPSFLAAALAKIPPNAFHILLAHHPDFLKEAFARQVPLTLAGHTHGGQMKLFGRYLLNFGYRYLAGLYQDGRSYGYVHTGTGQWLPLRVNCPPAVSLITLRKEQ